MKPLNISFLLITLYTSLLLPIFAVDQTFISTSKLLQTEVRGNTESSFMRSGFALQTDFDWRTSTRFQQNQRLTSIINGGINTLPGLGQRNIEINKLQLTWREDQNEYILGDFAESFSPLSFNQKLYGLSALFALNPQLTIQSVTGLGNRTWTELFDDANSSSYRSIVAGVKLENKLDGNRRVFANIINRTEQENSASLNQVVVQNTIASLGFQFDKLVWTNFALDGEYARSNYASGQDDAYTLKGVWQTKDYKALAQLKQIGSNYNSIGTPIEQDFYELLSQLGWSFWDKQVFSEISYRQTRDNLSGQKTNTLTSDYPKLQLVYKPNQDFSLTYLKENILRKTNDQSISDATDLNRFKLKSKLGQFNLNLDFSMRDKIDHSLSGNANVAQNIFVLSLVNDQQFSENFLLNSSYTYQLDAEQYLAEQNASNLLSLKAQYRWPGVGEIVCDTTWWAKHRVGQEDAQKELYDLSFKKYLAKDSSVALRYVLNNYTFGDSSRNYAEGVWSLEGNICLAGK